MVGHQRDEWIVAECPICHDTGAIVKLTVRVIDGSRTYLGIECAGHCGYGMWKLSS